MPLTINPEWDGAPFELSLKMADGTSKEFPDPVRFREQDKDAAIKAMQERDWDMLDKLAMRQYIEEPPKPNK